ncbi:MAG TPA: amidohydrolase/deacetylase family metallohydrolase [Acetobacteraceae bacterium]|jgi:dihydroorotase|nr:amidohydrolase/deacetylase family metallohydrolase [Acetobacteraceae bacterium]
MQYAPSATPLLLRGVVPIGFGSDVAQTRHDVLIGADGKIAGAGRMIAAPGDARVHEANGAYVSPGWVDLHAHVYYGGTAGSIRPNECGAARGVSTIVDAGSSGESNFRGFREYVIEPARERVLAFLNIGSIGLVASNRVSELIDIRSIDIDRTIACVEANRDIIIGIKVRASHVILGGWGITPVKVAKKVAKILKLPLMVHVGEPPPLYDEVLEILGPGDVVTHCFNGKKGGSIAEDEDLFRLAERCAADGIRLDIGHGNASFSFRVGEVAIKRGLLPFSISTDLHQRSLNGPVWDMSTTMSKVMALGMDLPEVIRASTVAPMSVVGLPTEKLLSPGTRAELTVFDVVDAEMSVIDSMREPVRMTKMIEPRATILGAEFVEAARHMAPPRPACPHCGQLMPVAG